MHTGIFCVIILSVASYSYEERIPCGDPGASENGQKNFSFRGKKIFINSTLNDFPPGTVVDYECVSNTFLFGDTKRQCFPDGRWDKRAPQCIKPENISLLISSINSSNYYSLSHREEAPIDGNISTCMLSNSSSDFQWWELFLTRKLPIKVIKTTLLDIYSGVLTLWVGSKSENKKFLCNQLVVQKIGTKNKVSVYTHSCSGLNEADWIIINSAQSQVFPLCEIQFYSFSETKCVTPDTPSNGYIKTIIQDNKPLVVKYFCHKGYSLIGDDEIQCKSNKLWSGVQPICRSEYNANFAIEKVTTIRPQRVSRSSILTTSISTTSIQTTIIPTTNSFSIKCPQLKEINGQINYSKEFNIGSKARLNCFKGYQLSSGYDVTECMSRGNWSHFGLYNFTCKQIECSIINFNPKFHLELSESSGKATYSAKVNVFCKNESKKILVAQRHCSKNGKWVEFNDIDNEDSHSDLETLCLNISLNTNQTQTYNTLNETLNTLNETDSFSFINGFKDMNALYLIITAVIAAGTTSFFIFIVFSIIWIIKRKTRHSRNNANFRESTVGTNFSFIKIEQNFSRRRSSYDQRESNHFYHLPIYENDEEYDETSFTSRVTRKRSFIYNYSEPFDSRISGQNLNAEGNSENIYSEPYHFNENNFNENEIYSN